MESHIRGVKPNPHKVRGNVDDEPMASRDLAYIYNDQRRHSIIDNPKDRHDHAAG